MFELVTVTTVPYILSLAIQARNLISNCGFIIRSTFDNMNIQVNVKKCCNASATVSFNVIQ
jgi:hypothetical protein